MALLTQRCVAPVPTRLSSNRALRSSELGDVRGAQRYQLRDFSRKYERLAQRLPRTTSGAVGSGRSRSSSTGRHSFWAVAQARGCAMQQRLSIPAAGRGSTRTFSSIANNGFTTAEGDDDSNETGPPQNSKSQAAPDTQQRKSDASADALAAAAESLPPEMQNSEGRLGPKEREAKIDAFLRFLQAHAEREKFDYGTKLEGGDVVITLEKLGRELAASILYLEDEQLSLVADGLLLAFVAHLEQRRKSGEPYIIHPVAVGVILGDLHMDYEAVIAGLLHDTVEDTDIVTFEILNKRFGRRIKNIVEGETRVSKLKNFTSKEERKDVKADDLQQMFFAMTDEVGVIVVKLADRLHNMRTLGHMPPHKQIRIARETLEVFAPLAHLLGLYRIKVELEDLAFRYGNPEAYSRTVRRLDELATEQEEVVLLVKQKLLEAYDNDNYSQLMVRRPKIEISTKTPYSIYKRAMDDSTKGKDGKDGSIASNSKVLDSLYDFDGDSNGGSNRNSNIKDIRNVVQLTIVLESKSSLELDPRATLEEKMRARRATTQVCYHFLGLVHAMWPPIPGALKDYIAMPKPNGYQSLHTRVMPRSVLSEINISKGPGEFSSVDEPDKSPQPDKPTLLFPIELQIRTQEMNNLAEYGIAAQVKMDREQGTLPMKFDDGGDWNRRISWLDSIREWQKEFVDGMSAREFVDTVTEDLLGRRVFVFTPKGKVMNLPRGSTVVDYAYHIHTQVGNTMLFSRVNGAMVPPSYVLDYADVVDVVCHTSATPKMVRTHQSWLPYAKTKSARHKLLKFIRENQHMLKIETVEDESLRKNIKPLNDDQADAISAAAELAINAAADFDAAACMMTGTPLEACRADQYSPDKSSTNAGWEALLQNHDPALSESISNNNGSSGRSSSSIGELEKQQFVDSIMGGNSNLNINSSNGNGKAKTALTENSDGLAEEGKDDETKSNSVVMDGAWFGVETCDRNGLLAEVSTVLTNYGLSILAYSGSQRADGSGLGRMVFELAGEVDMSKVCESISQIESVRSWSCGCILGKSSDTSQNGNMYM